MTKRKRPVGNFIKFMGTAGARHVVSQQLRSSAGIWLEYAGTRLLIDPGPGTLLKVHKARPCLSPPRLDAIVLTHRHVDHSCDINVMIEAMTRGGTEPRGKVFLPSDALNAEPVIYRYARAYVEEIKFLRAGEAYKVGSVRFATPVRHQHGVETYGIKFFLGSVSLSLVADTAFFPEIPAIYQADIMVLNTVRLYPTGPGEWVHLCIDDVCRIIHEAHPKLVILTHFGLNLLKADPKIIARQLTAKTETKVIAATDGMLLKFDW